MKTFRLVFRHSTSRFFILPCKSSPTQTDCVKLSLSWKKLTHHLRFASRFPSFPLSICLAFSLIGLRHVDINYACNFVNFSLFSLFSLGATEDDKEFFNVSSYIRQALRKSYLTRTGRHVSLWYFIFKWTGKVMTLLGMIFQECHYSRFHKEPQRKTFLLSSYPSICQRKPVGLLFHMDKLRIH